jgi:hypothetical protein
MLYTSPEMRLGRMSAMEQDSERTGPTEPARSSRSHVLPLEPCPAVRAYIISYKNAACAGDLGKSVQAYAGISSIAYIHVYLGMSSRHPIVSRHRHTHTHHPALRLAASSSFLRPRPAHE